MIPETKIRLQNLSVELGKFESECDTWAYKLQPGTTKEKEHDIVIQVLDKLSRTREKLKAEEAFFQRKLVEL